MSANEDIGEKLTRGYRKLTAGLLYPPAQPIIAFDAAKELAGQILDDSPVEAKPAARTEVAPSIGTSSAMPQGTQPMGNEVTLRDPKLPPMPKQGKSRRNSRLEGTLEPGFTQQEAAQQHINEAQVQQYVAMKGWATLQAGLVSQNAHEKMAFVAANDADAARRMIDEEFPKFHAAEKKLQQELEDIRTLRVNPYQYFQDARKGGRVGAVLATAVGQMAAGAGGVNNARKALKAAIDRDIEAQAYNIELQFKGVEAAQDNIDAQLLLLEEEILFRDKARAYAWEAANAVIQSAVQGAANETTYLGLQMISTFASMQSINAAAALRAKQSTIYIEEPINRLSDVIRARRLAAGSLNLLQKAFNTGKHSAEVDRSKLSHPATLRFQDAGMQMDLDQVRGNAEMLRGQPAAEVATPDTVKTQPKPSVSTRRPGGGRTFEPDMTFTLEEAEAPARETERFEAEYSDSLKEVDENGPVGRTVGDTMTPDAIRRPDEKGAPKNIEYAYEDKPPTVEELQHEFYGAAVAARPTSDPRMNAVFAEEGSHAQRFFNQENIARFAPKIGDMANRAIKDPFGFFANNNKKALMIQDAEAVRAAVEKYGKPPPGASKKAHEDWLYRTKFAEFYEANTSWWGKQQLENNIETSSFGTILLRASQEVRGKSETRKKLREDIAAADNLVHSLRRMADLVSQTSGDFMGFRFDPEEDSWEFTGFDESQMAVLAKLKEAQYAMGIQWIKNKDPSGRLSDQDIKLAMSVIDPMGGVLMRKLDMMQTAARGGGMSNVRKAFIAYLRAFAVNAQEELKNRTINQVVQMPDSWRENKDKMEADKKFFRERYEEQGQKVPTFMGEEMDKIYAIPGGKSR